MAATELESVRVDKWLHVARVFKTRSRASKACDLGRVRVNGQRAKSHRALRRDDRVEVEIGDWQRVLVVRELRDKPLPKAQVPSLFDDESPPRPKRDDFERLQKRSGVRREKGAGRPTKRERRQLERLRRGS